MRDQQMILRGQLEAMKKNYADQLDAVKTAHTERLDQVHRFYVEQQSETAFLFEGQLHEQMDISAGLREDASTITMGANILLQLTPYMSSLR
jgi:hypothetical protein